MQTCVSLALTGFVLAGDCLQDQSRVSNGLCQYAAFAIAAIAFVDYTIVLQEIGIEDYQEVDLSLPTLKTKAVVHSISDTSTEMVWDDVLSPGILVLTTITVLGSSSWTLLLVTSLFPIPSHSRAPSQARLDTTFTPPRALDIVISRYDEPASHVAATRNHFLRIPNIAMLNPRVIIYDKSNSSTDPDSTTFTTSISQHLSTPSLDILYSTRPNIGREGETTSPTSSRIGTPLATHTLFLQAEIHSAPFTPTRMKDYFTPHTGFLSLSYSGEFCTDCARCRDKAGWSKDAHVLNETYSAVNAGATCANLVRTYKGQLVISARRIRGDGKAMYEGLLRELVDAESAKHRPAYWRDEKHHRGQVIA